MWCAFSVGLMLQTRIPWHMAARWRLHCNSYFNVFHIYCALTVQDVCNFIVIYLTWHELLSELLLWIIDCVKHRVYFSKGLSLSHSEGGRDSENSYVQKNPNLLYEADNLGKNLPLEHEWVLFQNLLWCLPIGSTDWHVHRTSWMKCEFFLQAVLYRDKQQMYRLFLVFRFKHQYNIFCLNIILSLHSVQISDWNVMCT